MKMPPPVDGTRGAGPTGFMVATVRFKWSF
jgi:hypothetical protein